MSNISDLTIRKKISLHAKILAAILFVELGLYAAYPIFQLPSFAYSLFPVWIWGKIAITDGSTYIVISSILLLMLAPLMLFIWAYAYPQKVHYEERLKIWFILFATLLGYTWIMSGVIHISVIFPPKSTLPLPPGALPIDFESRDRIASGVANTPPVHSVQFILFLIAMLLYTAESIWMYCLFNNAKKK